MKGVVSFVVIFLLSFSNGEANEFKAVKLYEFCTRKSDSPESIGCSAYITGFTEGLFIGKSLPGSGHSYCPPKGMTTAQARLVIEKFLRERPQMLNEAASSMAMAALVLAFPCNSKSSN